MPSRARPSRPTVWALAGAVALVALGNGLGSIGPATDPAGDACRHQVGPLVGVAGAGDLAVVGDVHLPASCARYLTGADGVDAEDGPAVQAAARRARARGGQVFAVPP